MDEKSKRLVEDCFLKPICDVKSTNVRREISSKPKLKTELQLLMLSNEAQALTLNTLRYIYGSNFILGDSSKYTDKGGNMKKSYWHDRGKLIIQSMSNFSNNTNKQDTNTEDRLRRYAITKLENYGFAKYHCKEALDHCSGDLDKALELLYFKYIKCDVTNKLEENYSENELLEIRQDEKDALKSIYDKCFEEKEKNTIWTLKLELKHLLKLSPSELKKQNNLAKLQNQKSEEKLKPKCRNFAKGFCKFAEKCRFSHEIQEYKEIVDENQPEFYLEIRFPKNSRYPYEAPIILLKSTCHDLSSNILLQISKKLYREAQNLASDGMPSIYSITEFLQSEEEITRFLSEDKEHFPSDERSIFDLSCDENLAVTKEIDLNLPSHYKKGITSHSDRQNISFEKILHEDKILSEKFMKKCENRNYKNMLKVRQNLPAFNKMEDILNIIKNNQAVVISGETGCGKSTQVPQFILDDWLYEIFDTNPNEKIKHTEIICTQPRRLSAIGVAERVAKERNERVGETVGYQIRLENKISLTTRLTFCTTGILLQRLLTDPYLKTVSHIILDEIHERSEESDFLIMILKDILKTRKDLKVILMSATLNAELFSNYFNGVPVLEIPGKTFPVQQFFLEEILDGTKFVLEPDSQYCRQLKKNEKYDYENELQNFDVRAANENVPNSKKDETLSLSGLSSRYSNCSASTCKTLYLMNTMKINPELIENVLNYIVNGDHDWPKKGTVLIFLPGYAEIQTVYEYLFHSSAFNSRCEQYIIVPLHSSLSSEEQSRIFYKVPQGKRRIVLSTNIAETSITIDDCVFVIDCGLMKEKHFDANKNMESLELVWESRANAQQRKGRAGRVMPGICIHLFTSNRYKHQFISQPIPEILRVPLEQLILRIKILPNFEGCSIIDVKDKLIEPPSESDISSALTRLKNVGAINDTWELTPLGYHLSALPVDVRIGKLMLFGAIFQCLDSVLTIAACLSHKSPFISPFNRRMLAEQKKRTFSIQNSDHLTVLNAYKKWNEVRKKSKNNARYYADENFLCWKTLESISDVKYQFLELLVLIGFVPVDVPKRKKYSEDNILEITGHEINCNNNNNRLILALICAALYPNIAKVLTPEKVYTQTATGAIAQDPQAENLRFITKEKTDGFVSIHPSSVNFEAGNYLSPFLIYQEKFKTHKIFIKETSMIPLMPLVLFCGADFTIELSGGDWIVILDKDWIVLKSHTVNIAEMIQYLRIELLKLLEEKIRDPCLNILNHKTGKKIIETIVYLVSRE